MDWSELLRIAESATEFNAPALSGRKNLRRSWSNTTLPPRDEFTEVGHARRFVDLYGQLILYVADEQAWYVWEGHRWTKDHKGTVISLVMQYGEEFKDMLFRTYNEDARRPYRNISTRLGTLAGVKAVAEMAKRDERIQALSTDFDQGDEELNTPAGVVNLRTGETAPPDPAVLVRRSTTVAPDFNAECPKFEHFLATTFAGEPDKTRWLQVQAGVTLIGSQPTQQFIYCKGTENGADGKSRLMELFLNLLGQENGAGYATVSDRRVFEKSTSDRHSTELAKLAGVRMVVTSELGSTKQLDADKVKGMVAGDSMTARFMRGDEFVFTPQFMLWAMSNHHAKVDASDGAFWRRAAVLEFSHSVPIEERIAGLDRIIATEEGPAVLAWMIQGARSYFEYGFNVPQSVQDASENYRAAVDTFDEWADESVVFGEGYDERASTLYEHYSRWCNASRVTPLSKNKFGQRMEDSGAERYKGTAGVRAYSGVKLSLRF